MATVSLLSRLARLLPLRAPPQLLVKSPLHLRRPHHRHHPMSVVLMANLRASRLNFHLHPRKQHHLSRPALKPPLLRTLRRQVTVEMAMDRRLANLPAPHHHHQRPPRLPQLNRLALKSPHLLRQRRLSPVAPRSLRRLKQHPLSQAVVKCHLLPQSRPRATPHRLFRHRHPPAQPRAIPP